MADVPRVQFPCEYPIKVVARTDPRLRTTLDDVFRRLAGPQSLERVSERPSSHGRFVSVTYLFEAQSEVQVAELFDELKRCPQVLMVL